MSKKLVLTAALGFLACVFSLGCCQHGACKGGSCANGSCGTHGYPSSEYAGSPEYASGEEDDEQVASSRPTAVTAQRPKSQCRNGSCPN